MLKKLQKNALSMHSYANLCKIMHANDPILLNSLRLNITKVQVKFHLDSISSFGEIVAR